MPFGAPYYAVLIILEKLFLQKKVLDKIPAFFRWLYSFLAAAIGWLFFSYTDIGQAFSVLASMFGFAPEGATSLGLYALLTYGLLMLIAALCSGPLARNLFEKLRNAGTAGKVAWALGVAGLFIITLSFLVNSSYSPFLYAKF